MSISLLFKLVIIAFGVLATEVWFSSELCSAMYWHFRKKFREE